MWRFCLYVAVFGGFVVQTSQAGTPSQTVRLRVQVQDAAGHPLGKAHASLFKAIPQSAKASRNESPISISKQAVLVTPGKDGFIETPELPGKLAYVLEIDAAGYAPQLTRWTHPTRVGTVELPPLKLCPLGAIKGTVVDRAGKPVENVSVIQSGDGPKRLETTTDRQGHFTLDGIPEGPAMVCFEGAKYRFFGDVLACPAENVRVVLERVDDPNPRVLKLAAGASTDWTEERRVAVAKQQLEPLAAAVLAKKSVDDSSFFIMVALARTDPRRLLGQLDSLKFDRPFRLNQLRSIATNALADPTTAKNAGGGSANSLAAISKISDPEMRLNAYLYRFQNSSENRTNIPERRAALEKARELIAASKEPIMHAFQLCQLGTQFSEIGDRDTARKVLQECRTLYEKMPAEARGRQAIRLNLAMAIARDDPAEAKKLASDLEPGPMLRLAGEIARKHPQDAEALLATVPNELSLIQLQGVGNNLPPLVSRVARKDPAAAERILVRFARPPKAQSDADSIFGLGGGMFNVPKEVIDFEVLKVKACCYGLIADSAAKQDPEAARHALLQAVELIKPLRQGVQHPMNRNYHTPSGLMAMLVPVAYRVDPALANEILWRAISLRPSLTGESYERLMLDSEAPHLVNIVRCFDEALAEELLKPLLARVIARSYSGMPIYTWSVHAFMLMHPDQAIEFANRLSDFPGWNGLSPRDTARQTVVNVFTNSSMWDKDASHRLRNELNSIRNSYEIYLGNEDTEP
jgi:hypothetical protein